MRRAFFVGPLLWANAACGLIAGISAVPSADGGSQDSNAPHPMADVVTRTEVGTEQDAASPEDVGVPPKDVGGSPPHADGGHDAGHDSGVDSGVPPGYMRCAVTVPAMACNLPAGQECCDTVYGLYGDGSSMVYSTIQASCEAIDGPNYCGSSTIAGNQWTYQVPQSCAVPSDCDGGTCCALLLDAGGQFGQGPAQITCRASCSGATLCVADPDCLTGQHCVAETDPILAHVFPKRCE